VTPRRRCAVPAALLIAFAACKAPDIVYEPRPDDVIDGRRSALEAGVNTEMDYGPKQSLLLKSYQEAQNNVARLQKELDELRRGKQATETRLSDEGAAFAKEKALRVQAEAEAESLRGKRRELEARILSLGIEKAKLEQQALQSRIAVLQRDLEDMAPPPAENAAPPAGHR